MNHLDEIDVDDQTRELLVARARELAQRGRIVERHPMGEPVAVAFIGGERLGLPVSYLRCVLRAPCITRVPGLPPWMPGIIQFRSKIQSVFDLARWLGLPSRDAPAYLAMLEEHQRPLGLLIDGVAEVRQIFADEIAEQYGESKVDRGLPVHFTTRDLVAVLDVERLFALADRHHVSAGSPQHLTPGGSP